MAYVVIDTLKCTGCRICEFACSYHRDREFTAMSSSIILHRTDKKNYFGVILKLEREIVLARPEGEERLLPGQQAGEGSSGKPIVMREHCDGCDGEEELLCVLFCPTGCLQKGE